MTNNQFKPFSATFTLLSPMQTGNYPVMLDGMLYNMVEMLHQNADKAFIDLTMDSMLAKEHGIYKASTMLLVRNDTQSITAGVACHTTVMHWEDYNFRIPARRAPKKNKDNEVGVGECHTPHSPGLTIVTKGGPYRNRVTKYDTISPLAVRFYGVGDIDKVGYYLSSVFGIGKSFNQGHGQVGELILEQTDCDQSWFGDATGEIVLHRQLPVEVVESINLTGFEINRHDKNYINMTPPYFVDNHQLSYFYPKALIVFDNAY